MAWTTWLAVVFLAMILSYNRASVKVVTVFFGLAIIFLQWTGLLSGQFFIFCVATFIPVAMICNIPRLRQLLLSQWILKIYRRFLPRISDTERAALEAGDVWWEAAIFSGMPQCEQLRAYPAAKFSHEEQMFLDGPVATLCNMLDDWEITTQMTLSDKVWQYIRDQGFFGLIIPKTYGGKEFSATMHAEIITRLATRSLSAASIVSVPNSLGPAELLLHYGTPEQKEYYLPRLAKGLEIPCFALTGPEAGSDAGAIPDIGIVTEDIFNGKKVLGLRLTWNKRYITLAPVATVLGLAFKLYDPNKLLSDVVERGITCALIPVDTTGVIIGRRHNPLNMAFPNGPTQGKDVFVPLDYIIGGAAQIGQGWRMLVECLSAGRAISLPSMATGAAKLGTIASGIYAQLRIQFNVPIGHFEGIQEPLARMGGWLYLMDATRYFTTSAIDHGVQPSVASAIVKYHITELSRHIINDAMDVHGGKGICLGPKNYLGRFYQGTPIAITVEGANILTRSLIIFGQGILRCHPYLLDELAAAQMPNKNGLPAFDKTFWQHAGFIVSNFCRSLFLSVTNGRCSYSATSKPTKRYYQHLMRLSAAFAFTGEMTLMILGESIKRREKLSARLGDVVSYLYLLSATLKRFHDRGEPEGELILMQWACQWSLYQAESALNAFLNNFPSRIMRGFLKLLIFPFKPRLKLPNDKLGHSIATSLLIKTPTRDCLAEGLSFEAGKFNHIYELEQALLLTLEAATPEKTIRHAIKENKIFPIGIDDDLTQALKMKLITSTEYQQVKEARAARRAIINVDDFAGLP